jgi:hypothetical protein
MSKRKRGEELLERREGVRLLFDETYLSVGAVVGAVWLVDHAGGFPVSMLTLQAAAWIGYKQHETAPSNKLSYFGEHMLHGLALEDGMQVEEMRLLQAVSFSPPSRDRLNCVYELGAGMLEDEELDKGVTLSLLLPGLCGPMTDDQYARCVVFAAAYKAGKTVEGLVTAEVPKDYIFMHGMRIGRH